jgi:Flp pilus assembly protein TadD
MDNPEQATQTLNELIATESAENSLLFANLYNALGSVYEKAGQLKEARTAYLHTNLLYASEPDEHAEALYHLALIWPQLEETDRANEARDTLKTRYRNSYWAGKL